MSEEFKADHFINMEELLDTIKEWLINEELYGTLYDDFNRFFDTGAMEEMYYYIKQLQQENKQLKNNWNELNKWLEEEHKRNINWYGNLTHHDKQYCLYEFGATKDVLDNVQNKMQELEGSNE